MDYNPIKINNKVYARLPEGDFNKEDQVNWGIVCLDDISVVQPFRRYKDDPICEVTLSVGDGAVIGGKSVYLNMTCDELWDIMNKAKEL